MWTGQQYISWRFCSLCICTQHPWLIFCLLIKDVLYIFVLFILCRRRHGEHEKEWLAWKRSGHYPQCRHGKLMLRCSRQIRQLLRWVIGHSYWSLKELDEFWTALFSHVLLQGLIYIYIYILISRAVLPLIFKGHHSPLAEC